MQSDKADLLAEIAEYYSAKLTQHGETPQGVDWNGEEGQLLRFEKLCKIIGDSSHFSINDLGCGYGSLYDFLSRRYKDFYYTGIDISESMILAAKQRHQNKSQIAFFCSNKPEQIADYSVASGIFNVCLDRSKSEWQSYFEEVLDSLDQSSRLGFAFNCLTSYTEADRMLDYLYYANPGMLFDLCKRRYSRNVALLHDYNLYEFTILVRKPS